MSAEATRGLSARIERFLFSPINLNTVALFRLVFGAALALLFLAPAEELLPPVRRLESIVWVYERVIFGWAYEALCVLLILAFASSIKPRASGWLLVLLLAPLAVTSPLWHSRQLMLTCLVALCLIPDDRADSACAVPIWPVRLIQLELSCLYAWNAIAKATPGYLSGDALVAMSRALPNFLVDLSGGFLELGPFAVPVWVCAASTVLIEAVIAVGLWFRSLRWAVALVGVAFHAGLGLIVQVGFLDLAAVFLFLVFLLPFEAPVVAGDTQGVS